MDTFDMYYDNSVKDITRTSRAGKNASRQHELSLHTSLPPQKVCLTMIKIKVQLINLTWVYFGEYQDLLPENANALVVTGSHYWHPCRSFMDTCRSAKTFAWYMRRLMWSLPHRWSIWLKGGATAFRCWLITQMSFCCFYIFRNRGSLHAIWW